MSAQRLARLIIDAMSSFAAIEIRCANDPFRCADRGQRQMSGGVPGMGLSSSAKPFSMTAPVAASHWQWTCTINTSTWKTGQWRFTPPTHVVVALAGAIAQFEAEGGQPARLARYTSNYETLVSGMRALGSKPFLDPSVQAPIIVTFSCAGAPELRFQALLRSRQAHGFILYPGKLTQVETFRVGCIGAITPMEIEQAVHAVALALRELGIPSGTSQ